MAFLAGPAALALLGGIAAPGAAFSTLGAAVGWTVGAWLFGPKANSDNQIFDPGAEEMPRINQALRGATMPIFFGTNRMSSNVVWTANFTTVRKESTTGGGGKAGGSGGAKMGAPPAQVSYEYKWDMLFHIGMSPVPVSLYGGWINTDKISNEVIQSITEGSGNQTSILPDAADTDDADIAFEDSYFGAAYSSSSTIQDPWDNFEVVEGQPARFPHTAYIGFDQLYLGSSPRIPQFTWEVGPGTAEFTGDGSYARRVLMYTDSQEVDAPSGGAFMMRLESGDLVYPIRGNHGLSSGNGLMVFVNVTQGTKHTLTEAEHDANLAARGLSTGGGTFSLGIPIIQIPGTKYFYTCQRLQVGVTFRLIGLLYSIEDDGSFLPHYGYRFEGNGVRMPLGATDIKIVGLYGEQRDLVDPVIAMTTNLTGRVFVLKLPAIEVCLAANVVDDTVDALDNFFQEVTELDNMFSTSTDHVFYSQFGYVLPTASVGLTGVEWQTYFWHVSNRSQTQNQASDPAWNATQKVLYPDGYITQLGVSVDPDTGYLSVGIPVVNNTFFVDAEGAFLPFPFADDNFDRDGTAADSGLTGYVGPNVQKLPASLAPNLWLMIWPKQYDVDPASNVGTQENYVKLRAFIWNPFNGDATDYGSNEGPFFSAPTDLGTTNIDNAYGTVAYFDPTTNDVFMISHYNTTALDEQVVIGSLGNLQIGGQVDVTPAYIVYTILTHPVLGAGISESAVDQTSYLAAVAYCEANDIKVSVQYNREDNLLAVLEQLLSLFNCFLVISGGIIKFGLQDFSIDPVRTLDNHHLVTAEGQAPVQTMRSARQDSYNKVRVNYFDRALSYRQNQIEVADEVDIDLNGVRVKEFPPKFVMTEQLANNIAIRALWTNLYARDTYNFKIGPKDRDLEPGDPITLVDSYDPQLSSGVRVRIGRIRQVDPAVWEVTAVRELDYTQTATLGAFSATSPANRGPIIGELAAPLDFRAYELPAELQTSPAQIHFGYNPGARAAGARLYVSPDGITYGVAGDIQPFVINGMFAKPLPAVPTGFVSYNVEVYLSPVSGFNSATPTYVQTYAIDDVSEAARQTGAGVIIAGSEALAMENLTLLGQNHYRIGRLYRGWGGTKPQDHSSGAYWHRHASGVLGLDVTQDKIGTQFYYKIQPYNFAGVGYDIASIAAKHWTIKDVPVVPQPISHLTVFANSALAAQSVPIHSGRFRSVYAEGSQFEVRWLPASRTTGFGTGGYGFGQFGRFARDVTTPSYRFEVLSGNTMVRSTVVNTEAFDYSVDANSTDFNGWKGQIQFRVTPFNEFGDAVYSTVHSLNCTDETVYVVGVSSGQYILASSGSLLKAQ